MPRTPQAILDEFLVIEAQTGSPEAWRGLVERWHPLLLRRAVRLLGEPHAAADAVQDAWVSVARGLARLDDPARFGAWVYRILTRRCADHVGRAVRRPERPADMSATPAEPDRGEGSATEDAARVRAAIAQLPGEQHLLLSLRYADSVPVDVIAGLLGIPEGTVKSRLHAAREALRRLLEPEPHTASQGASHG